MWFWVAAGAGLASAIDKILNRMSIKAESLGNVVAYSFLYMLLVSVFALGFSFPIRITPTFSFFVLIVLQAFFWSLGTLFSFLSQSKTEASLSTIISRARALWMIPLGYFFLGENLGAMSVLGIVITFLGLAILFYKNTIHTHRGIHLMLLGSIAVAMGAVINALLLDKYLSPAQTTFTGMFGQVLVFWVVLVWKGKLLKKTRYIIKNVPTLLLSAAAIETFALIGLNWAYKNGPVSTATAIYLGMSVSTVWIGIFFLKEKTNIAKKIISSAIVTIGLIILKVYS